MVDPKYMGKPRTWDGTRQKWRHFAISLKGYVGAISPDLLTMMKIAQTLPEQVDHTKHAFTSEMRARDAALYYILTNVTEGDAADIVDAVEEGHGLECWRLMAKPNERKTITHNRKRLAKILEGKYTGNFLQRTTKFESEVKEYERLSGKKVDEEVKLGVLESKLSPETIREHLSLHGEKYETYKDMKDRIEQYPLDKEGQDEADDPMDVDAIGYGKGKDKGKGKGKRKGKGKDEKGKGARTQVPWWEQWQGWYQRNNAGGSGGGKEGSAAGGKFQGYCSWCKKWGHKQMDCFLFQKTEEYKNKKAKWDEQKKKKKEKKDSAKKDDMDTHVVERADGADVPLADSDEETRIFGVVGDPEDEEPGHVVFGISREFLALLEPDEDPELPPSLLPSLPPAPSSLPAVLPPFSPSWAKVLDSEDI